VKEKKEEFSFLFGTHTEVAKWVGWREQKQMNGMDTTAVANRKHYCFFKGKVVPRKVAEWVDITLLLLL